MKNTAGGDEERWWAIEQKMERYHHKLEKQYRTDVEPQYVGLTTNWLVEIGTAMWGIGTQLLPVTLIIFMFWTIWYFGEKTGALIPNVIPWFLAPSMLIASVILMGTGHLLERWGKQQFRVRKKNN